MNKKLITCKCGKSFKPRYNGSLIVSRLCDDCLYQKAVDKVKKDRSKRLFNEVYKTERRKPRKYQDLPLNELKLYTQKKVNEYVRMRDNELFGGVCISCGRTTQKGNQDAGHYFSQGGNPALRYDLSNIHLQCKQCNLHKHANLEEYRKGLINRFGVDFIERLERNRSHHEKIPIKYTRDQLINIVKTIKQLKDSKCFKKELCYCSILHY